MDLWGDIMNEACSEAVRWVGDKSPQDAWETCHRGDWMLWAAAQSSVDRRVLVAAACDCAELSLRFLPAGELRPAKEAIDTAREWCSGGATLGQVRKASASAYAASAYAASAYAASASAYAASASAYAAYATYATYAAAAAYAAAYADDADDAREKTLAECAHLVRNRIPFASLIGDSHGQSQTLGLREDVGKVDAAPEGSS